MYAAWRDNICFKSSSLPPRKALRMAFLSPWLICFLLSAFFKYKFFEVLSLSITIYTPKYYVTKKEPAMFCSANFPRLPRKFHWIILNNFRLSRQEETINKNKQNKTQQNVSLRPKLKEKCRDFFYLFFLRVYFMFPMLCLFEGGIYFETVLIKVDNKA